MNINWTRVSRLLNQLTREPGYRTKKEDMMKRITTLTATTLVTAWSLGCVEVNGPVVDGTDWPFARDTTGQVRVDFNWSGLIARGNQIEIKGVFGNVRAVLASGSDVVVTATRIGQPDEVAAVEIEVVTHSGGVTICAVYPDVPGQQPNRCAPGNGGNMSVRDSASGAVQVEFTVQVPREVVFVGRTLTGNAEAIGLESDAFLSTLFGDVRISTTRLGTAETMAGSIEASIGLANWDRDLEFRTMAGDIVLRIPSNTNADVEVDATAGSITSDFPLNQTAPGVMRGTIGAGGRKLKLATMQGDIRLRRTH
jgi:hypothetical protein